MLEVSKWSRTFLYHISCKHLWSTWLQEWQLTEHVFISSFPSPCTRRLILHGLCFERSPHRNVKQQKGRTIGGTVLTPWSERCFLQRSCRLMVAKWWLWGPWEGGRYLLKLLTLLSAISEGTGCKVQKMTAEKAANRNKTTVRMPKCNGLHFFLINK